MSSRCPVLGAARDAVSRGGAGPFLRGLLSTLSPAGGFGNLLIAETASVGSQPRSEEL